MYEHVTSNWLKIKSNENCVLAIFEDNVSVYSNLVR
jgi:hypothetical protein